MRFWMIAILLMTALAGCADPADVDATQDPGPATGDGDAAGNVTDDGAGTAGGDGAGNASVLLASLTPSAVNGSAPLAVTFNVSATGAGPNATWSLDFGDGNATDGASLPATANHTFQAGNFSVVLTVTDGDATAQADLSLSVASAGAASGAPLGSVPFEASGMFVTGTQGDGFVFGGCGITDSDVDVASYDWVVPAEVDGVAARAASFTVHMDLGQTNVDSDVYLHDPAGTVIGSSADFNAPGLGSGSPTEDFTIAGSFEPGTYKIVVRACTGVAMDYEVQGQADLVSA